MKKMGTAVLMSVFLLLSVPALKAQKDSIIGLLNKSNDWPNLRRYHAENAQLQPETGRVVFMGNSITEIWKELRPDFFKKNPFVDRGISGQTTPQMLLRFRQDVIDLKPAVVVILAGINDIAGNTGPSSLKMIEDNIASMAQLGKQNAIRVVLSSVLPAFSFPWREGIAPAPLVIELNDWIKEFAKKNNFIYLDYYSKLSDSRGGLPLAYSADGVHPNEAGFAIMEPLAEMAISSAMEQAQ